MKLVVQLAANRGELDVEADSVSVESGALVACRDGQPVLVLASRVWSIVHPADEPPHRPQLPDVSAAFPPPTRQTEPEEPRLLGQAQDIPDTVVRRSW